MNIAMIGQKGIPALSGGIEKHVEEIGKRLVRLGHNVDVFCRPHYTDKSETQYEGINLIHRPTINSKHLDAIVHTAFCSFESIFRKYDIVHFHALGPSTLSFIPFNKKVVVTVHGLDWKRQKWGRIAKTFLRLGEYTSVKFPNETIVVSKTLKKYYEEKYNSKVNYIPNGVFINEKKSSNEILKFRLETDEYILFLARLVPEKGCHYLIDAYKKLNTNKKLVIAGDSSHSDKYVEELIQHKSENIIFTGFVTGDLLKELYSNAYLYILPSEIEGLPITLLEAMSYGKCVLASDISENIEAIIDVDDSQCGFSFKSGDTYDLSMKMNYLLDNPELVKSTGLIAKERVKKYYDWDHITGQIEEVYTKLY